MKEELYTEDETSTQTTLNIICVSRLYDLIILPFRFQLIMCPSPSPEL